MTQDTTDFDVIVIGSGAGGLTTALAAARGGKRVLVLEQHYLPGGWCHTFPLDGYHFSPGVHYLGELGEGGYGRRIYEGLGVAGDIVFGELNPDGFDHVILEGERFDIPKGRDALAARLKARFPDEAKGIDRVLKILDDMGRTIVEAGPLHVPSQYWKLGWHMRKVWWHGLTPYQKFLKKFVSDPRLIAILSIQAGDHGVHPREAITAQQAAVMAHYFDGGYYPIGGGRAIPRAFIKNLRRHGGKIRLRTKVDRILLDDRKRVRGVRLEDGEEITAPAVVSNADPKATYDGMLGAENVPRRIRKKLDRITWSCSNVSLFFAVDMDVEAAGLDSGNYWWSNSLDVDKGFGPIINPDLSCIDEIDGTFLTVTSLKDPTKAKGTIHTMESFVLVHADMFDRWKDTEFGDRPADYDAWKEAFEERMFVALEELVPGISEKVVFSEVGTPVTNKYYLADTKGSAYGTEKTWRQLGPFMFPMKTPVKGLFHVGASTLSHGIMGAQLSGLVVGATLLGTTVDELLAEPGPALTIVPSDDPDAWPEHLQRKLKKKNRDSEAEAEQRAAAM